MSFYEIIAAWTISLINFVSFEMFLSLIFHFDKRGGVKFTISHLFGNLSPYQSTAFVIAITIPSYLFYDQITNYFYSNILNFIASKGLKTIPAFIFSLSLAIFWGTKINLGRSLENKIVLGSLVIGIISLILMFLIPSTI